MEKKGASAARQRALDEADPTQQLQGEGGDNPELNDDAYSLVQAIDEIWPLQVRHVICHVIGTVICPMAYHVSCVVSCDIMCRVTHHSLTLTLTPLPPSSST